MFTFIAFSRLSASFTKIPFLAPLPIATIKAVGVANPSAQGQAITKTVIEVNKAKFKFSEGFAINQTKNVSKAIPKTIGTNIPAILSTNCCTGALEA